MSQDEASNEISAPAELDRNAITPRQRFRGYVEDVRVEMRHVSWPSWMQVRSTTFVVLFFTFAMTAFFKVIDLIAALLDQLVVGR